MRFRNINIFAFVLLLMTSCIEYEMSYPRVLAEFEEFVVEGAENVNINPAEMTVTIELSEEADLEAVKVTSVKLNDKAYFKNGNFPEILDLTSPFQVMLSMYQDYRWTIRGVQDVDRYVNCVNQVGNASFFPERREVYVYISKSQRLKYLRIDDMKLDLAGSKVISTTGFITVENQVIENTQDCEFPMILDCSNTRKFSVQTRKGVEEWTLTAIPVDVPAQIKSVAAWAWSADVHVTFDGTSEPPVLMYRKSSDSEWLSVPEENVVIDGINCWIGIDGLEQLTDYELKLNFLGEELPGTGFTTCYPAQLPNFNFDEWWSPNNGALWYPYAEDAQQKIWDSANTGTASFGLGSSTVPESQDLKSGKAVRMTSRYVAVKFASGTLFTGTFKSVIGTSGADLDWGIPFTSKPKALKGWCKYQPALVDYIENKKVSDPQYYDQGQLQVILIESESPYRVLPVKNGDKTLNGPTYQDPNTIIDLDTHPTVIARGVLQLDNTDTDGDGIADWINFTLPLEYRDNRTPTYVIVTAASSYLGDFFTGGDGSVLLIDEFEFIYE